MTGLQAIQHHFNFVSLLVQIVLVEVPVNKLGR